MDRCVLGVFNFSSDVRKLSMYANPYIVVLGYKFDGLVINNTTALFISLVTYTYPRHPPRELVINREDTTR